MGATALDVVKLGLTKVGYRYWTGPTRDTGQDGYFDCSGFATFLERHMGNAAFPYYYGSHDQALYCRDHGLLVPGAPGSQQQIDATPIGGLLFEGPQHAYVGGYNIQGHVVVKIGPNLTVEAMGKAWGVCIGRITGRNWSNAGYLPGVDYSNKAPVQTRSDTVEGPQLGDDMAAVVPSHALYKDGLKPWAQLDFQDGRVICYNGLRIRWRMNKPPAPEKFKDALVYDVPINPPFIDMQEGKVVRTITLNTGEVIKVTQEDMTLVVLAGDGGVATADMILP